MMGLRGIRDMKGHDICLREQLLLAHKTCSTRLLNFRRRSTDIMIDHLHLEADRATRHNLSDPTQAENAKCRMMNVQSKKLF